MQASRDTVMSSKGVGPVLSNGIDPGRDGISSTHSVNMGSQKWGNGYSSRADRSALTVSWH